MPHVTMVITNNGDGSNSIKWVKDPKVLARMEELADDGDETYASGDGLQKRRLGFPEGFNMSEWMRNNHLTLTTLEDVAQYN